ncbi:MAG TPA: prephenate/arogenate dehydrogenase [Candidatus Caenarcaniphilales bacterium]
MEIGIVGLGLIGGSLGLDLRRLGHQVCGVSRQEKTCQLAIARGAVDRASTELASLVKARVIFICTPLDAIQATIKQLIPHLRPDTILTDVGSVKAPVVEAILPLWSNFIGGHPMAGTAETGIAAAQMGLFAQRPYVLTPVETTSAMVVDIVAAVAGSLGAQVHYCEPAAHDRAVAWISHLPTFASASLIAACLSEPEVAVLELAQQLASSGFRDSSRVGGGNPQLGRLMAEYNRTELLRSLRYYRQHLDQFIAQIEQQEWAGLEQQLLQTQQARPQFLKPLDKELSSGK